MKEFTNVILHGFDTGTFLELAELSLRSTGVIHFIHTYRTVDSDQSEMSFDLVRITPIICCSPGAMNNDNHCYKRLHWPYTTLSLWKQFKGWTPQPGPPCWFCSCRSSVSVLLKMLPRVERIYSMLE